MTTELGSGSNMLFGDSEQDLEHPGSCNGGCSTRGDLQHTVSPKSVDYHGLGSQVVLLGGRLPWLSAGWCGAGGAGITCMLWLLPAVIRPTPIWSWLVVGGQSLGWNFRGRVWGTAVLTDLGE